MTHGHVSHSYSYNSLRQLTQESLTHNGFNKTFSYGYNLLGHQSSISYPDPSVGTINVATNMLGQPKQAIGPNNTVYVQDASYYPTGSLNRFTYGNGIVHQTTLNSRQLPSKLHDYQGTSDIVELSYRYDNQNNVTRITDGVNNQYSITHLSYDGLDRLISTTGHSGICNSKMSEGGKSVTGKTEQ